MESSSELSGSSDSENYRETQLEPGEDSERHAESIKRSEDVANPSQAGRKKMFWSKSKRARCHICRKEMLHQKQEADNTVSPETPSRKQKGSSLIRHLNL